MRSLRMAGETLRVVNRRRCFERLMRVVARETGKSAVTVAETGGAMQVCRLVAYIPGVRPVRVVVQIACLAMACSAQNIDLLGREPFGILDRRPAPGTSVRPARSVAGFAVDATFARLHLEVRCEHDRSGGVAAEAAQRRSHCVEGAIDLVRGSRVTGGECEQFRGGVISEPVFGNCLFAGLANPRSRLRTSAEGPFRVATRAGIGRLRSPQRMRVPRFRLRFELIRVAGTARSASDVSRWRLRGRERNPGDDDHHRRTSKRNHRPWFVPDARLPPP